MYGLGGWAGLACLSLPFKISLEKFLIAFKNRGDRGVVGMGMGLDGMWPCCTMYSAIVHTYHSSAVGTRREGAK